MEDTLWLENSWVDNFMILIYVMKITFVSKIHCSSWERQRGS